MLMVNKIFSQIIINKKRFSEIRISAYKWCQVVKNGGGGGDGGGGGGGEVVEGGTKQQYNK